MSTKPRKVVMGRQQIVDLVLGAGEVVLAPGVFNAEPRNRLRRSDEITFTARGFDQATGILSLQGSSGIGVEIPARLLVGAALFDQGIVLLRLVYGVLLFGRHYKFVACSNDLRGAFPDELEVGRIVFDPTLPQNTGGLFSLAASYATRNKKLLVLRHGSQEFLGQDLIPASSGDAIWAVRRVDGRLDYFAARDISSIDFVDTSKSQVA